MTVRELQTTRPVGGPRRSQSALPARHAPQVVWRKREERGGRGRAGLPGQRKARASGRSSAFLSLVPQFFLFSHQRNDAQTRTSVRTPPGGWTRGHPNHRNTHSGKGTLGGGHGQDWEERERPNLGRQVRRCPAPGGVHVGRWVGVRERRGADTSGRRSRAERLTSGASRAAPDGRCGGASGWEAISSLRPWRSRVCLLLAAAAAAAARVGSPRGLKGKPGHRFADAALSRRPGPRVRQRPGSWPGRAGRAGGPERRGHGCPDHTRFLRL